MTLGGWLARIGLPTFAVAIGSGIVLRAAGLRVMVVAPLTMLCWGATLIVLLNRQGPRPAPARVWLLQALIIGAGAVASWLLAHASCRQFVTAACLTGP